MVFLQATLHLVFFKKNDILIYEDVIFFLGLSYIKKGQLLGGYTMKKIISLLLTSCLIGFMMLTMLTMPSVCITGATEGLLLWFHKLVPSLLPFIILMNMLCSLGIFFRLSDKLSFVTQRLFSVSGTTFMLFLLGLVGGYPMGAKLAKQLLDTKQLTYEEAEKSLCFGTNCGPIFIIGTVGTIMLGNTQMGYFLLLVHILSALFMLLLSRFYTPKTHTRLIPLPHTQPTITLSHALTQSVQNGMDTIVYVGGYIIFFSVIIHILKSTTLFHTLIRFTSFLSNMPAHALETLFLGSLEFSNGSALATTATPVTIQSLAILSALIAFGGFCVFFQCSYVLQGSGLPLKIYLISKIFQSFIAYSLTFLLPPIFPLFISTSNTLILVPLIILLSTCFCTSLVFKSLS